MICFRAEGSGRWLSTCSGTLLREWSRELFWSHLHATTSWWKVRWKLVDIVNDALVKSAVPYKNFPFAYVITMVSVKYGSRQLMGSHASRHHGVSQIIGLIWKALVTGSLQSTHYSTWYTSHTKQQYYAGACTSPHKLGHITYGNVMGNACFTFSFSAFCFNRG